MADTRATAAGGGGGGLVLALYLLLARRGPRAAGADGAAGGPARPAGALVWLHAGGAAALPAATRLVHGMRERGRAGAGAAVLITTPPEEAAGAPPPDLPAGVICLPAPPEALGAVRAFLDRWQPDQAAFVGGGLRPALIQQAWLRGIPLLHLDAPAPRLAALAPGRIPGLARVAARAAVRRFDRVLARDDAARRALERAGVPPARMEIGGALQDGPPPLPHTEAERAALAHLCGPRPVWAALGVGAAEEAAVIEAHAAARRHAHRLLLVLAPDDPARGPEVAARVAAAIGDDVARRGADEDPDERTAVYVADTEGEAGLWLRMAGIVLLGGTLVAGGTPLHPFAAAAFGAAVLHGPHLPDRLRGATAALDAAGAARAVTGAADLAAAIGDLIAPDTAAAMAHAAWEVISARDAATARAADLLAGALPAPAPARTR